MKKNTLQKYIECLAFFDGKCGLGPSDLRYDTILFAIDLWHTLWKESDYRLVFPEVSTIYGRTIRFKWKNNKHVLELVIHEYKLAHYNYDDHAADITWTRKWDQNPMIGKLPYAVWNVLKYFSEE